MALCKRWRLCSPKISSGCKQKMGGTEGCFARVPPIVGVLGTS